MIIDTPYFSPKDGIFQSLADIALNIGRAGTAHETHIGKNRGCRLSSTVDHNGGHIISNTPPLDRTGSSLSRTINHFSLRIWPKYFQDSSVWCPIVRIICTLCVGTSMSPRCLSPVMEEIWCCHLLGINMLFKHLKICPRWRPFSWEPLPVGTWWNHLSVGADKTIFGNYVCCPYDMTQLWIFNHIRGCVSPLFPNPISIATDKPAQKNLTEHHFAIF